MTENIMFEGLILTGVHTWWDCQGMDYDPPKYRSCIIHRPTPHHMRLWSLTWRDDRGIFERHCKHGVGHPDPDQFDYWRESDSMYQSVHGCDGCCRPPFPGDQEPQERWSTWRGRNTSTVQPARDVHSFGSAYVRPVANPDRKRIA